MNNAYFCGFCESSGIDFPYIGHMGVPNDFGRKYGRKNDQNLPNFFSKKRNIKRAQKPSFIKIVPTEPILAYICDMAQMSLPLRVGTTIATFSS